MYNFLVLCNELYVVNSAWQIRHCSEAARNLKALLSTMPKEVKHTVVLQKQRQKLKEKNQKYVPGTVALKVLGSGAKGAPRSLYVFTDQSRYLFNCGEGTQRLAHEHKMKLSKLEHIFITHRSWENVGGLPGVALTVQDVGVPEITIHGPEGTDEIFNATRRFVILRDLSVKMAQCSVNNFFEDNVMKVNYIPIVPVKENGGSEDVPVTACKESAWCADNRAQGKVPDETEDDIDYYAHERKRKMKFPEQSEKKRVAVSSSSGGGQPGPAMAYVCRLHPRRGSLCLEKCVERGVRPGPQLGRLKAGEDVVLEDGTVVRSADVCLPDDPGPVFIVAECPTVDYLNSLVSNPMLSMHQSSASKEEDFAVIIVHFSPQEVLDDPRYKAWMGKFPFSTQHLIINEENECMGSTAVHRIQHKLNLLHPRVFPMLEDNSIRVESEPRTENSENLSTTSNSQAVEQIANKSSETNGMVLDGCSVRARTFDCVHLRPRKMKMLDQEGELTLTPKLFVDEVFAMEGFDEALRELKDKIIEIEKGIKPNKDDPQIVFLGTGSCIPNKTRNTSGILLHMTAGDCMLLDCGEGTYGQIVRLYGTQRADCVLRNLRAVFVSHLHADHHIGLIGLLKARRRALRRGTEERGSQRPVFLIAPQQIMSWLSLYHRHYEHILQEIQLVPNTQLILNDRKLMKELEEQLLEALGMAEINTVPVKHCPNSFGIAVHHRNNWKITYSGDTMPCPQLVELGVGSDVLIHEATMEDDLEDEALLKLHSTTTQAIQVGQMMGAKFILLTHFSQRYSKIPRMNDSLFTNVGIAFDNMQVHLNELPLLPHFYPALKIMFAEHVDEMEQKAARRLLRQEREREILLT